MEFEQHEYEEVNISEEDETLIRKEAKDPEVFRKIVNSIAPAIHGYDEVKESIALQLFGGSAKPLDDGTESAGTSTSCWSVIPGWPSASPVTPRCSWPTARRR